MSVKIELPECGIFIGSGIYPTDTDTLLSTMLGHYTWQAQSFGPIDMLDAIEKENQGNLAQVWGVARGFSPKLRSEWFYALDEIGVNIPAPDWENFKNLTVEEYQSVFDSNEDRFGAGLLRFINEAKKRGIYTCFIYTNSKPRWIPEFTNQGGKYYLGYDFGERYNIGLDDAKAILEEAGELTLGALADRLLKRVREHVGERHASGWGNVMATSSNFSLDYEVVGGTDIPVVEDFAFTNLNFSSAFSRGLYREFDLPMWGSHLAHEHYSWLPNSCSHRWDTLRSAFYLKYMAGSKMIINESGNWFVEHTLAPDSPKFDLPQDARAEFGVIGWGAARQIMKDDPKKLKPYLEEARKYFGRLNADSPVCRRYREIISDFWDFVKENGTPEGQPETTIALAKGNYDFCNSRFIPTYAIGGLADIADKNPNWFEGAPEKGWEVARRVFFPLREEVTRPYVNLQISGTPYGQVDVVTFARDGVTAEFLNAHYKAVMFTGWNTCSEKQYEVLKEYVCNGGTLFISLPQLSTNQTRNLDVKLEELVNGGDFSELCGMKINGKGDRFYWATAPIGQDKLFEFPRRFGIIATPIADVEITDPELEILACDDEIERPLITLHKYGKGKTYFMTSWAYPGANAADDGPGGTYGSGGLPGFVYRHIANENRGNVYITDDRVKPGNECDFIAFSYFPEGGKICLHNVDYENEHAFYLHQFGMCEEMCLEPGEFMVMDATKNQY